MSRCFRGGSTVRGRPGRFPRAADYQRHDGGLHYGVPLKWSIALGYILPGSYKDWQPFAAVEPGIGGFRASLGALKMTNELGGGYYARATALRTTSKAWRAPAQPTYVGPELQFMAIFAIGLRLGGFVRVGAKATDAVW